MSRVHENEVRVAIVGAGPAGIGTALGLARHGIRRVLLLERWDEAGGVAAKYRPQSGMIPTYVDYTRARVLFGKQFAENLLSRLAGTEVELRLETSVLALDVQRRQLTAVDPKRGKYSIQAEAMVLATGAREESLSERGWIAGSRAGRVLHTMQLLQLLHCQQQLGWNQTAVVGSDLIGYLAAAKLKMAKAGLVRMIDTSGSPQADWLSRLYFRRWVKPQWEHSSTLVLATGRNGQQCLQFSDGRCIPCDALVVSGRLIPNSELLFEAGIEVQPLTGIPYVGRSGQLAAPGCFVAGNGVGGFHGGQWCYYHGRWVAKRVARYLHR